jgi:putative transposase
MNRGIDGRWIVETDTDKGFLRDLLIRFKADFDINVYHWAVLSSHFHLAIETLSTTDLSAYVGKVCRRYTLYHHDKHGGSGPLWVRRFQSVLVQKQGYLPRLGRYIERNGLRAGLTGQPWQYTFCSAGAYIKGADDGLVEVNRHPIWGDLSRRQHKRRRAYAAFLGDEAASQQDEPEFRSSAQVIGDEAFLANARRVNGRPTARGRGRPRSTTA